MIAAILASNNLIESEYAATRHNVYHVTNSHDKLTCAAKLCHTCPIRPLIDTGSNICLITSHVFNTLPRKFRYYTPSSLKVQTANGTKLRVIGKTRLPISFGSQVLVHDFIIVDQLKHSIIIGLDLLELHCVGLHLSNYSMSINNEHIPLQTFGTVQSHGRI